jgi:uncharacterized protein (DUF58 family)
VGAAAVADLALTRSPARVDLAELIKLRPAGESLQLARQRVRAKSAGGHLSPFKGRGVEFEEARPYEEGDDLRMIDWRVTARTGKPYTKVFREERDRPVILWLDMRRTMMFATQGAFKAVRASQTAALIAWSTVAHGDRLGGLVFSERGHLELRPRLGRRAALRLLQALSQRERWPAAAGGAAEAAADGDPADGDPADGEHAVLRLTRVARPGSMVFMLSDFRDLGASFDRHLRQLARHSDVFLVHIFDPIERDLPPPGRYRIQAGASSFAIDTDAAGARERYRAQFQARHDRLAELARVRNIQLMDCSTVDDPRAVLTRRFKSR